VDVRFGYFSLIETTSSHESFAVRGASGLIETAPGSIRCRTGYGTPVRVSATVSKAAGPIDLSFDDIVEASYWSPTGQLAIADWQRHLVEPVPSHHGACWYRLRYHLRNPDDARPGECLLQLWSAEPSPPEVVKVTSRVGRFWHAAWC
jgi:hypothetical protein